MSNESLLGTIVVGVSAGAALGAVVATAISLSWQARYPKDHTQVLVAGKTIWVQLEAEQVEAVLLGAEKQKESVMGVGDEQNHQPPGGRDARAT